MLAAALTSQNLTRPRGLVLPTLLVGELYKNCSAGQGLINTYGADAAQGNVVFASEAAINPARRLLRLKTDDGVFSLGYFQIADS